MTIKFKLTERAKQLKAKGIDCTPVRGSEFAAGMDLKACIANPVTIYPRQTAKIMTGVCVFLGVLEESDQCQLAGLYLPRSSAQGLVLVNTVGLLDCDYQGESFVKLRNVSDELITIEPGERLVQLIVVPVLTSVWKEVNEFDEITGRGEGGDGSTGRK